MATQRTSSDFVTPATAEKSISNCRVGASWTPGVVLTDKRRMGEATIWVARIAVCNRHRRTLDVDTVLKAMGGWDKVMLSLMARGHRKPKKGYTKLAFRHLRPDL